MGVMPERGEVVDMGGTMLAGTEVERSMGKGRAGNAVVVAAEAAVDDDAVEHGIVGSWRAVCEWSGTGGTGSTIPDENTGEASPDGAEGE